MNSSSSKASLALDAYITQFERASNPAAVSMEPVEEVLPREQQPRPSARPSQLGQRHALDREWNMLLNDVRDDEDIALAHQEPFVHFAPRSRRYRSPSSFTPSTRTPSRADSSSGAFHSRSPRRLHAADLGSDDASPPPPPPPRPASPPRIGATQCSYKPRTPAPTLSLRLDDLDLDWRRSLTTSGTPRQPPARPPARSPFRSSSATDTRENNGIRRSLQHQSEYRYEPHESREHQQLHTCRTDDPSDEFGDETRNTRHRRRRHLPVSNLLDSSDEKGGVRRRRRRAVLDSDSSDTSLEAENFSRHRHHVPSSKLIEVIEGYSESRHRYCPSASRVPEEWNRRRRSTVPTIEGEEEFDLGDNEEFSVDRHAVTIRQQRRRRQRALRKKQIDDEESMNDVENLLKKWGMDNSIRTPPPPQDRKELREELQLTPLSAYLGTIERRED